MACIKARGLAFLRFAILLYSEIQGRPSLVCPFAGASVHWTFAFCRLTPRTFILARFSPVPLLR